MGGPNLGGSKFAGAPAVICSPDPPSQLHSGKPGLSKGFKIPLKHFSPRCLLIPFCGLRTFSPDNPVILYVSTEFTLQREKNFLVIVIILISLHVWYMEN